MAVSGKIRRQGSWKSRTARIPSPGRVVQLYHGEIGSMPWIIGIDEAGYGPNLGPFVMTSAACRVPDKLVYANLWQVLRRAVRRHSSNADGRLLVEDSKIVYSPSRGLHDLERGVLALLALWRSGD